MGIALMTHPPIFVGEFVMGKCEKQLSHTKIEVNDPFYDSYWENDLSWESLTSNFPTLNDDS